MSSYTNRLSLPLPLPQEPVMDEETMKPGNWMGSVLLCFLQYFDSVGCVTGMASGL